MALKDIQNIDQKLSTFGFDKTSKSSRKLSANIYKILIISESSSDIFMINKILSKNSGFRVDEAVNFSSALKIINHLSLDLIIVDDSLSTIDGYDVIDKLNSDEISKYIPKILLLSDNYNIDKKANIESDNINFIQKPLNLIDFKSRVRSILELSYKANDYFQNMADIKYFESKDYSGIYKKFFDLDSNILFVYDPKQNRVIEANSSFTDMFSSIYHFNRIISSEKLFRKFVPMIDKENYLNYYDVSSWLKMISFSDKSSFMLQINRSNKIFNFLLEIYEVSISNKNIFICKFINLETLSSYGVDSVSVQREDLQNLEKSLELIKEQIGYLSGGFMSENIHNELDRLKLMLKNLSTMKSSKREIKKDTHLSDRVNVYEVVSRILKDKYYMRKVLLNSHDIHDQSFEFDKESIYMNVDITLFKDLVSGILSSYFGGDFDESSNHSFLHVEIYKDQNNILIEIREPKTVQSKNFFIDKFFKKDDRDDEFVDLSDEILPKNVEYSINKLSAKLKKALVGNENIFLISIPV